MKKQLIKIMTLCTVLSAFTLSSIAQAPAAEKSKATPKQEKAPQDREQMMEKRQAESMDKRIDMRVKSMKEKLSLTDDQATKIRALYKQQEKVMQERMEAMQKEKAKMNDEMAKILTPEQMEKYKQAPMRGKEEARPEEKNEKAEPAKEKN